MVTSSVKSTPYFLVTDDMCTDVQLLSFLNLHFYQVLLNMSKYLFTFHVYLPRPKSTEQNYEQMSNFYAN